MTEHELDLEKRRERQFAIVRRGLREAARVLLEMEESLAELDAPVEVEEPELELEFDMSELEEEIAEIYHDNSEVNEVIEVTDDMVVDSEYLLPPDPEPTVLDKLEGFLEGVKRRQFVRDTFL